MLECGSPFHEKASSVVEPGASRDTPAHGLCADLHRRLHRNAELQRTSGKEICVTLASSSWEGRDHLRPKYCKSPSSNANAASWCCLAVAWTVVFLTLLHRVIFFSRFLLWCSLASCCSAGSAPTTWTLSSASGGYVSSPHVHDVTGRNSSSTSSVLAALPPLVHRQQTFLQASGKEMEATAEAGMPVSEGIAGGPPSLTATGSPDALTVTSTVAAPPASTATEVSTLPAAAVSTAAPAGSVTTSVPAAATPATLALLTRIAAPPAGAASAALPSAAEGTVGRAAEGAEVSRTRIDEAVYAATSKPTNLAGAPSVGAPSEGAGRAPTAATRSRQATDGASSEDGRGGEAQGGGEGSTAAGEENEAAAATAMEPEESPAGRPQETEGVRFSGGRVNGYFWRSAGRASFLSTTAVSAGLSVALHKAAETLEEAGATGNAARAPADEPTHEAEERRKAHAAAVAAPEAPRAAFHATEISGDAAGGRTASWRAAVAAHKKSLEEEARAARNAASKLSAAEEEAAARRVAAARSEASARKVAMRRDEEGTKGVSESVTDSCAAVLQPMVRRGLSEAALEKIKRMLAVERFVEKVSELRKIAARKCLAGEKDACETPENPVWQTAGLSKPPEAPTIKRFTLPADLCPAPSAGSGSTLQGRRAVERLDGGSAASTVYNADQVRSSSGGETKIYMDVTKAQGSKESAATAAAASFLVGAEEETDEANRRSYVTMEAMKDNDVRSTFLRAETTGAKEEKSGERFDSNAAAGCKGARAADRSFVETPGEINIDVGRPPPATHRSKDSGTSESSERESSRREGGGGESTKRSVSRTSGGSSDGESSTQDSSHSTVRGVLSNSSSSAGDTQKGRWTGQTSPVWGRMPHPRVQEGATAEEGEQGREAILSKPAVWGKRRNFYKSRRAPLQLRMGPDDSPVTLLQARSRGIFSTLQSLFGNGMDISNPQNFDGGNQGSFFNFMYPSDTDYPWACVCDENQWKRWENKEIEAVPCRNQVDTSAQGITAACNPLNHHLSAASPSRAHASAIILGLLSAATILVSTAA